MNVKKRFIEFDGMRTLAILLVLLHHLQIDQRVPLFADLFRYFALGIFVFISGYLLSQNPQSGLSWRMIPGFLWKRAIRILPLYIIALIFFVIVFGGAGTPMNFISFVIHCFGLQLVLSHPPQCDPVLTLWYIGLIIPYYIVYALFSTVNKASPLKIKGLILMIAFPLGFVVLRYFTGISDKRLVLYFLVFIAGIFSARRRILDKITGPFYGTIGIILIISCVLYSRFIYPPTILASRQPPLFSFISLMALVVTNIIMIAVIPVSYVLFKQRWMARCSSVFSFVAYASYCMYLFHRPFWWGLSKIYYPVSLAGQQMYSVASIPILIIVCFFIQKRYDGLLKKTF